METTQHTPADVREQVAKEVYLWEATRFGADESWALRRWREESNTRRRLYFNVADRILALLRTPRGEGEAKPVAWRVEYRRRGDGDARWYHLNTYTNEIDARERAKHAKVAMRLLECRIIPLYASPAAALRSEAQGEDRWEDVVFGPITEWMAAASGSLAPTAGRWAWTRTPRIMRTAYAIRVSPAALSPRTRR